MKVVGLCGWSGAGKTTLIEQLVGRLRQGEGGRVSVIKHAHHGFDIDRPGKDSWRHRQAGAYEVLIASDQRLAKLREYEREADPDVHALIGELAGCDWVLVEGYRRSALPKIEIWRASVGKPVQYPDDPHIVALATDSPGRLPVATALPLLDLNDPDAIARHLLTTAADYEYTAPADPPADAEPGRGALGAAGGDRSAAGD